MKMEVAAISISTAPATYSAAASVQHVTKSSSDQLLSKFADDSGDEDSAKKKLRPRSVVMVKDHRQRYNKYATAGGGGDHHSTPFDSHCDDSPSSYASNRSSLVERKTLLPCANNHHHRRSYSSALLRQLGIGNGKSSRHHHHHLRAGIISFRNKSLFGSIHKTWRRTVQGASKVLLMEKQQHPVHLHYNTTTNNRHKRLINL